MKRNALKGFAIVAVALLLISSLSGCVYANMTINLDECGSGTELTEIGFDTQWLKHLYGTESYDGFWQYSTVDRYMKDLNGRKYYTGLNKEGFTFPEEMLFNSGVTAINGNLGSFYVETVDGGFELNVALDEEYGPNMKPNVKVPSLKDATKENLKDVYLYDAIAQNVDGLFLNVTVNMPYDVKQVSGSTIGVTVKGKTITLDYMKMAKSGEHSWKFSSVKTVKQNVFPDVSNNAWYAKSVNAIADGGMVKGFGDGNFYPNKNVTLAELCAIVVRGLHSGIKDNKTYWAKDYIEYAQRMNFVLSKRKATKENWDIPATREQAAYAISVASGKELVPFEMMNKDFGYIEFEDIKDVNEISEEMKYQILLAYNIGMVQGLPDGRFAPKSNVTRAEICQMFYNIGWKSTNDAIHVNLEWWEKFMNE